MAAPEIPNLNNLRSSRATRHGQLSSRGGHGSSADAARENTQGAKDLIVQETDHDASISRLSAIEAGYLDDSFAKIFVGGEPQRRFPIINRGTYVRTVAIDTLVNNFLSQDPSSRKQIISLGAGSDTRYFRLVNQDPRPNVLYHEIDFPTNTTRKIATIKHSPNLARLAGINQDSVDDSSNTSLRLPDYCIHAMDLRDLQPTSSTTLPNVDHELPTLLISECCLIYLPPTAADAVVGHFVNVFTNSSSAKSLGIILYEPINPFDSFGKVMVSNLAARGIVLQTLRKYSSLEAQRDRLRVYGFKDGGEAQDVGTLWKTWISEEEKERVDSLEGLDEVEEWDLLAAHYCVVWGWTSREERRNDPFETWKNLGRHGR